MPKPRIENVVAVLLAIGAAVAIAHGSICCASSKSSALAAAQNLEACRELTNRIMGLRNEASSASLRQQSSSELTSKLESAAASSGIRSSDLIRINPQQPRRAGKTAYLQEVTEVDLRRVTLQQLARFLLSAVGEDSAMYVSSIRINAPRNSDANGQETWDAEVSLTRLVFSPQSARST
ncbi:MAG: hypothetical protein KDB27_15845 [Planctomycetales bacterium]|nr:hypothetical protein [Planctomycetales bacterium]